TRVNNAVELLWSGVVQAVYSFRKNFWVDTLATHSHTCPRVQHYGLGVEREANAGRRRGTVCRWFDTDMPVVESLVTTVASQISEAPCRTVRCGIGKSMC